MSFTSEVSKELASLQIKKTCCRKAIVLGILCGAKKQENGEKYVAYFYERSVAELAAELLKKIFRHDGSFYETNRAGRKNFVIEFNCSGVSEFLRRADTEGDREYIDGIFKCAGCRSAFLRGVFLGCGSITDPKKGYHMEFSFSCKERAKTVARLMEEIIGRPGEIKRPTKYCLYYKNNGAILDFLYCVGSNHASLYMANSFIERDIRNNENRATNCVARNISRSVVAAQKQINAIERLMESKRIESLDEELRYTAKLRIENESASLSELAQLHEPPISKSGLNGRLKKLVDAAEKI